MPLARPLQRFFSLMILAAITSAPTRDSFAAPTAAMLTSRISQVDNRMSLLENDVSDNLLKRTRLLNGQVSRRHSRPTLLALSTVSMTSGIIIGVNAMRNIPIISHPLAVQRIILFSGVCLGFGCLAYLAGRRLIENKMPRYDELSLRALDPFQDIELTGKLKIFMTAYTDASDSISEIQKHLDVGAFKAEHALNLIEAVMKFRSAHQSFQGWVGRDINIEEFKPELDPFYNRDKHLDKLDREFARVLSDELIRRVHLNALVTEGLALKNRLQYVQTNSQERLPEDDGCKLIVRLAKADRWI